MVEFRSKGKGESRTVYPIDDKKGYGHVNEELRKELIRHVNGIARDIMKLNTVEKAEDFLNNAIDVSVENFLGSKEVDGFSVLITSGGPNI